MDDYAGYRAPLMVAGVAAALLVVAGCAAPTGAGAPARPGAESSSTTHTAAAASAGPREVASNSPKATVGPKSAAGAGPADEQGPTPSVTVPRPSDPLAPGVVAPVIRGGVHAKVRASAPAEPFSNAVTYKDGVRLRVTGMTQSTVSGQGPGVFTGEPTTAFSVAMTNGSRQAIALNHVVVTASYGSPARVARPVYGATSQDFGAAVQPKGAAKAVYAFSIPTKDLGKVTIAVDFDGVHAAATFRGTAK